MKFYLCVIFFFLLIFKTAHTQQLDLEEITGNITYSLPSFWEKQDPNIVWIEGDDQKLHGIDVKIGREVQQIPIKRPFSAFGITHQKDRLFLLDCYNFNISSLQSPTQSYPPKLLFLNTTTWQQEGQELILNSLSSADPRYELEGMHLTKDYLSVMIRRQQIDVYVINLKILQVDHHYMLRNNLRISCITPCNEFLICFDNHTNKVKYVRALEGKEVIIKIPDLFAVPPTGIFSGVKNLFGGNKKTLRLDSLKAVNIQAGENQGYISLKESDVLLSVDHNGIKMKKKSLLQMINHFFEGKNKAACKPLKYLVKAEKKQKLKPGEYVVAVSKDGNHLLVKNENPNQLIYYKSGLPEEITSTSSYNDLFFPLKDGVASFNPTLKTLSIFSPSFLRKEIKLEGKWDNSKNIRYKSLANAVLIGEGKNLYIIHPHTLKPFFLPLPFHMNTLCTFSEEVSEMQKIPQRMLNFFQHGWLTDIRINFK